MFKSTYAKNFTNEKVKICPSKESNFKNSEVKALIFTKL